MTEFHPTRRALVAMLGAACVVPTWAGAAGLATIRGRAFGTDWHAVSDDAGALDAIAPEVDRLFASIDAQMSPWRADSTLSRFNAGAAGLHGAEPPVRQVAGAALDLARRSEGAFDPGVGPLVARWGFGPIRGATRSDWRGLAVEPGGIRKARADLTMDLCGIAKGWALDRAVDLAREAGVSRMLFDLGGELRALGAHPAGRSWRVAVSHPDGAAASPATLRLPVGLAVATSGLGAQSYTLGGRVYGHIVDPSRGVPAADGLRSVTVVAPDAMTADGWATALFAAGRRDGFEMARETGLAALFLYHRDGALARLATERMRGMLL